ncbi:MAG: hypothetical protein RMK84_09800 [Oscillochloridaceae bacterium]|nr:hypothetical protein [Chloroflexaceae bacterium]MDW8390406.1 hypothetical protein [Oscillochloridaceae bacterium]
MRLLLLAALILMSVFAFTGCGRVPQGGAPAPTASPVTPTIPPGGATGDTDKGGPSACPRLDPVLYALTTANDPAAVAAASNIPYDQGRVLVFVTVTASVDFDQYDATLTAQTDQLAQALVPLSELCRLANDPNVAAVRPPDMAAPTRP